MNKRRHTTFILLSLLFSWNGVSGQRLYANEATGSAGFLSEVVNEDFAAGPPDSKKTTLTWFVSTVALQLSFPKQIKGGTPTFIRVDNPNSGALTFSTDANETANSETISTEEGTYVRIVPSSDYQKINITLRGFGLKVFTAYIYHAFNGNDPDDCGTVFATRPILPAIEPINP